MTNFHSHNCGAVQVVLMCSSEETPQAELQLLQAVQEVLKGSAEPHVMVYATQPFAPQAQPSKRSLLAVSAQKSQYVCDARCQTQVSCRDVKHFMPHWP